MCKAQRVVGAKKQEVAEKRTKIQSKLEFTLGSPFEDGLLNFFFYKLLN